MSIIMTGGGTGGHLAIIKAVKEHINNEMIYIGSTHGQDKSWFEQDNDFAYKYFLKTQGVVNQGFIGKIKSLSMLFLAIIKAVQLLKHHKAQVVFSVGGFSAAATSIAAIILRIPLVIHEQNAAIGSLNKLLKPFAFKFISSYIKESPIASYPVKNIFFNNARVRSQLNTIIFLGGSQGAKAINSLALQLAPLLKQKGIHIIHQAGEKNLQEVALAYQALGIDSVELFGFATHIEKLMQKADFAVARAGASTLWELSASGIPTLYIPYPYAASNHQYHNAKFLVDQNLAWVIREGDLSLESVLPLFEVELSTISQKLIHSIAQDGSLKIAQLLQLNIKNDNSH